MSYKIEPLSLKQFINDNTMKLPRFQRRGVWDANQKFELAVSIFQDYPVGVVIVNKEAQVSWLLDGRQRRSALKEIHDNPVQLYLFAKKYIGFKATADEKDLKDAYWNKIERYLQKEEVEQTAEDDVSNYGDEEDNPEKSFDSEKQKRGLQVLLDTILFVHQIKGNVSRFEKTFDYNNYFSMLTYAPKKEGNKVNPEKLRSFLLQFYNSLGGAEITEEAFCDYYTDMFPMKDDNKKSSFENQVNKDFDYIKQTIITIAKVEKVFEDARIGIIELTNVSPLDSQNIFSRINKGGTILKAEELLSAKPFWNIPVNVSDHKTRDLIADMYRKLGVDDSAKTVRWDMAATVLMRIEDQKLLFDDYNDPKKADDVSIEQISLGFKLLSSYFSDGMSAKSVSSLETKNINWDSDIDDFVDNINLVCKVLLAHPFFQLCQSWKKPIGKMMGNAIVLEFITICLKNWEENGRPVVSSHQYKAVQRDAIILFDRLVFEYSTKVWRGSGDSKMSSDIQNWKERIKPIDNDAWVNFITEASKGTYNGQPVKKEQLTPVLYYYYFLKKMVPVNEFNVLFDVDHIIPQEKFKLNQMVDSNLKDSLINLCILPKKDNISKSNKALNEVTDFWLKTQITTYSEILIENFDKYSDITNINDLQTERLTRYLTVFTEIRNSQLSN